MGYYSNLAAQLNGDIECHYFASIASTNDYLSGLAFSPKTQLCISDKQTHGKGQHGSEWISNKGNNILLSIRRVFATKVALNGLSLVVGLALLEVLKDHGASDLRLKWPNDVFYQQSKLAGILIENSVQNKYQCVVIGIGVNIDVDIDCQTKWTSLRSVSTHKLANKFDLSKDLINKILQFCQIFTMKGFAYFAAEWQQVDYLQGKLVRYDDNIQSFVGQCVGVDDSGALLVDTGTKIMPIYSSEFLHLC